jgi:hypothetical protein
MLEFEPSDAAVDTKRNVLLVPSLDEIYAFPLSDDINYDVPPTKLIELPNLDLEGLTVVGEDRIFALSEGPIQTDLLELAWNYDVDNKISLVEQGRWMIGPSGQAEGLAYVPSSGDDGGRLLIDLDGFIHIYEVPSSIGEDGFNVTSTLNHLHRLNMKMVNTGLDAPKIGALSYFEGVAYILFDNDKLIRSFDLTTGELVADIRLPRNGGSQWEGLAIERRSLSKAAGSLRGSNTRTSEEQGDVDDSELLVHMTFDTPPQVWTFVAKEGETKGTFTFPACAAATSKKSDSTAAASTAPDTPASPQS